jgi:hypothetical protein
MSNDLGDFLSEQMKDPEFAAEYLKVDKEENEKLAAAFKRNFEHQQLKDAIVQAAKRWRAGDWSGAKVNEAVDDLVEFEKREVRNAE